MGFVSRLNDIKLRTAELFVIEAVLSIKLHVQKFIFLPVCPVDQRHFIGTRAGI